MGSRRSPCLEPTGRWRASVALVGSVLTVATGLLGGCGRMPSAHLSAPATKPTASSATCLGQLGARAPADADQALTLPDLVASTWQSTLADGHDDVALVIAVEAYAGGPHWMGAQASADAWEAFFRQALGIPRGRVLRLHALDADADGMRVAVRQAVWLARPGGRLWFVFLGALALAPGDSGANSPVLCGYQALTPLEGQEWKQHVLFYPELLGRLNKASAQPIVIVDALGDSSFEPGRRWDPARAHGTGEPWRLPHSGNALVLGHIAGRGSAGPLPGTMLSGFSYLLLGALRGWADPGRDGNVTAKEAIDYFNHALRVMGVGDGSIARLSGEPDTMLSHGKEPGPTLTQPPAVDLGDARVIFNSAGSVLPALPMTASPLPEWSDPRSIECNRGLDYGESPNWNMEGELQLGAAYRHCKTGNTVGLWMNAWSRLAAKCGTRYGRKAYDMYVRLLGYEEQKDRIMTSLAADWPRLETAMRGKLLSAAEKARVLRTFEQRYPMLNALGLRDSLDRDCGRWMQGSGTARASRSGERWTSIPGGVFQRGVPAEALRLPFDLPGDDAAARLVSRPSGEDRVQLPQGPAHWVRLGGYELLTAEVTVSHYRGCVQDGRCSPPRAPPGAKFANYGRSDRENHPVNYVDWDQAKAYCEWVGGRLPSEAEWEWAASSRATHYARGCSQVVKYEGTPHPEDPARSGADPCGSPDSGTSPVCSRPAGNSDQGLCDLVGNVWEWTADSRHPYYCGAPADGRAWIDETDDARILRGGSWRDADQAERVAAQKTLRDSDVGFRCARDAP
jgi:sulfatase modifying factor 1